MSFSILNPLSALKRLIATTLQNQLSKYIVDIRLEEVGFL